MKIKLITLCCLASSLWTWAAYQDTVLTNKPVAYWRLNETNAPPPSDVATNKGTLGSAAAGLYLGAVSHPTSGALAGNNDTAATFDGSGARVLVPYMPALSLKPPFSVECWANPAASPPPSGQSSLATILSCGELASPRSGWLIYQAATGWNVRFYNQNTTSTSLNITGGAALVAGNWYHIVAVYDGTNATIYVNGAGTSGAPTGFVPNTDGAFTIGTRSDISFNYNGSVDEVALYTNALTAAEVTAHYQAGTSAASSANYAQLVQTKNPILYYRLNEPAYTSPDPSNLPVAKNSGSQGTTANGLYNPGTTPGVAGAANSGFEANHFACRINGIVGHVEIPTLNLGTDSATLMCWLKRNGNQASYAGVIFNRGGGGTATGLDFRSTSNELGYHWNDDANTYNWVSGLVVPDGVWAFAALVVTPTNAIMYLNDSSATNINAHAAHDFSVAPIFIGEDSTSGARIMNASIDEVAIFDRALTPAQIKQIYYSANIPASITQQPAAPTNNVYEGMNLTLSVGASGSPPLAFQWRKNGAAISGKTSSTLDLSNVLTNVSGNYDVVITNAFGAVTSSVVALTIQTGPPLIFQQPQPLTRFAGTGAQFAVSVGGSVPLNYQWKLNGTNISGATTASYAITSVQTANAGDYTVVISNPYGTNTSATAKLTVLTPTGYPVAVLADKPIAYWRLGETNGSTAFDAWDSHNGQYASVNLGQQGFSVIDPDRSAGFVPANSSRVVITDGSAFNFTGSTPTFTLEAWAKFTDLSGVQRIFSNRAPGYGFGILTATRLRFTTFTVQDFDQSLAEPLVLNKWYHIVGVAEAGSFSFYLNGQLVGSMAFTGAALSSSQPFQIGRNPQSEAENVNGQIDEAAVYVTALSADRVLAHYNARYGNNTKPIFTLQPVTTMAYANMPATLTGRAEGTEPIAYQWKLNGADVPGANAETLTLTNSPGTYKVKVTASSVAGTTDSTEVTLTIQPTPTAINMGQDLVLHLKFDGDYKDASLRGNNATNVGVTTFVAGIIGGKALHYSTDTGAGTYNYVTLGLRPDLQFGSNVNFSVAYWVRQPADQLAGDLPFIGNATGSANSLGYVFCPSYKLGGWQWSLFYGASAGLDVNGPNNTINDGQWHYLAHTFDRQGQGLTYLDGLQVDVRSIVTIGNLNTGQAVTIGQDPTGRYAETGQADIDDLGVWRRVITPLEVQAMYLIGKNLGATYDAGPLTLSFQWIGGQLTLTWPSGTLESASEVTGATWSAVPGAASPWKITPSAARQFYRLRQ